MFKYCVATLFLVLLCIGLLPASPRYALLVEYDSKECFNKVVDWVYDDAKKIDEATAKYIRYFTIYNLDPKARTDFTRAFSGHVHSLSLETEIRPPAILPETQFSILRIDTRDYGWKNEVYELLADADPYFHVKLIEFDNVIETSYDGVFPSKWFQSGDKYWRYTSKTQFQYYNGATHNIQQDAIYGIVKKKNIRQQITVLAPYLANGHEATEAKLAFLVNHLGTNVPFVRGDWFIYQTAAQNDRKPGYYDFVGIKDRKTFEDLIGFDEGLLKRAKRFEILEAVAKSGVSQKPRRIAVYNTVGDLHYHRTFDSIIAKNEFNPLRVLDDNFKHDAEESFGSNPVGFWLWGLFDDEGVRQNSAPDFIGYDRFSKTNNGRIEIYISCLRCHYSYSLGDSGIISFRHWVKNVFKNGFRLQSIDYRALQDIERHYYRDMDSVTLSDTTTHNKIVKKATGVDSNTWARLLINQYDIYNKVRNLDSLATDLCIEQKELVGLFKDYAQGNTAYQKMVDFYGIEKLRGLDLVLAGLVQGEEVEYEQYEEIFPLAAFIVRSNESATLNK